LLENQHHRHHERKELLLQLERQLRFETLFGLAPHEIKSIRVRASGYPHTISWVTMKDGTVHEVKGVDAKRVLEGTESFL
jgi:hypothetical protein